MKIILLALFFYAPLTAAENVPDVIVSTSAKTVNDIYRPVKTRDPMIASSVYSSKTGASTSYEESSSAKNVAVSTSPAALNFSILGIMDFYGNKEALLKDKEGSAFVCREGRIYDSKRKPVEGRKCDIKGRQIIIRDASGESVKLSFEK